MTAEQAEQEISRLRDLAAANLREIQRGDLERAQLTQQRDSLKAELADARRSEAVLRGACELLENADSERAEIAAVLETSRRARAGELLDGR